MPTRIAIAGWSIPRSSAASFPIEGSHLQRYAQVFGGVEINSSFYRPHRIQTYRRWATETPPAFRFAVKLPRSITHEARLRDVDELLRRFLDEAMGLGDKLAVLLIQLPPSLVFDEEAASAFFALLRGLHDGAVVCEPRHASWFTQAADRLLIAARVSRAAADPARWPEAARPGGWLGPQGDGRGAVLYHRWHGSPRMYYSRYPIEWLRERADDLARWPADAECWCVFDNTAAGEAFVNALELQAMLRVE
jgi:uncharacterized protein YecE (DUF72 family)